MPDGLFGDSARSLNFKGFKRARVVKRDDPKKEGRVGLFIPGLFTEHPADAKEPAPTKTPLDKSAFANADKLELQTTLKEDNYIWARPAEFLEGKGGGSIRVPSIGSLVLLFYEDEDPNKPYWISASPTLDGDAVPMKNVGKSVNVTTSAANAGDAAKRPDIDIIREYPNGTVIYADQNDDTNAVVIAMENGHHVVVHDSAESGIYLKTGMGHMVQLDENSKEIRIKTHSSKVSIVCSDADGSVKVTNPTGETTIKSKKINLDGPVKVEYIEGAGMVTNPTGDTTIKSKRINLNP